MPSEQPIVVGAVFLLAGWVKGVVGMGRDELIQALGLSFAVATLALVASLFLASSYPRGFALLSAAAVLPALIGMRLGRAVRHKLDPVLFRKIFFGAMLVVGVVMVVRAIGPARGTAGG